MPIYEKRSVLWMEEQTANPSAQADKGAIYTKDNGAGKTVLYFEDAAGTVFTLAGGAAAADVFELDDAATATVSDVIRLDHFSSGTAAAGYGTGQLFRGQDASGGTDEMGRLAFRWTTATAASETSTFAVGLRSAGAALPAIGSEQLILSAAGNLTVTGTGTFAGSVTATGGGGSSLQASTSGATQYSAIFVESTSGGLHGFYSYSFGPTFSSGGIYSASGEAIESTGAAGLKIGATNAAGPVAIYSGGSAAGNLRLSLTAAGSVVFGALAALATTATDGFAYIPTCAGTPTGTPTAQAGKVPIIYDTTNNKLYAYNGGWKGGTTPGTWI